MIFGSDITKRKSRAGAGPVHIVKLVLWADQIALALRRGVKAFEGATLAKKSRPGSGRLCKLGFLQRSGLVWCDHHDHLTTFHLRHILDLCFALKIVCHAFEQFPAQLQVCHFPATEAQCDFDLVTFFQKLPDGPHLDIIVMGVGVGAEFDLFDLDDLLLFPRLGFPLLLFIFELAKIHDFADGRISIRGNFNQI